MFIKELGSLRKIKSLNNNRELSVKLHSSGWSDSSEKLEIMNRARQKALVALKEAHKDGISYLIIKHDKAPFKRGYVSVGSQIRHLMRSHAAAPYMFRSKSIQLESAAIFAVRPKKARHDQ